MRTMRLSELIEQLQILEDAYPGDPDVFCEVSNEHRQIVKLGLDRHAYNRAVIVKVED